MSAAQVTRLRHGLDVVRTLPAPVPRVFRALSEPEELALWWGPPDYPVAWCTVDFRPGGVWHYLLRGVRTGEEFWARAVYGEITPPTALTYLETSSDATGAVTEARPAANVRIELLPAGEADATELVIRIRHQSTLDRDRAIGFGIESGLGRALDTLEALLRRDLHQKEHQ
ncbi:SRPBCC domain-containing protein [Amnibacterium sp.]|uniref:SRPBCC domain-containing protein n=1 Tax=Amnibacterium sp. TaxID=1872496 RepID=UPI00261F7A2B|nr:SRPBCC domain-containing protein [Amnibacterium sp.]MCU1473304.1 hypothetical protein [Amnibacterium sp.]